MDQSFIDKALRYKQALLSIPDGSEFRSMWQATNLPYTPSSIDPYSAEYKTEMLGVFNALTGHDYDVGMELTSTKLDEASLQVGYPWMSRDMGVISAEMAKTLQALEAFAAVRPGCTVIEFGAGWGNLALVLARAGFDVTAVDMDPGLTARLDRMASEQHLSVSSITGTFLDVSARHNPRFEAVVFQSSFHHCLDFDALLGNIVRNVLADRGSIFFLSEPISSGLRFPWGLRYDGEALWAIMFNTWLELGFSEDFFLDLLFRNGLVATRVPGVERFVGPGWRVVRAGDGLLFAQIALPARCENGFHPASDEADWGRFVRAGEALLPASGMTSCQITFHNYGPRDLSVTVRSGTFAEVRIAPAGRELKLHVATLDGDIHLTSETYVPNELLGNGDMRVVGVAVRSVRWLV